MFNYLADALLKEASNLQIVTNKGPIIRSSTPDSSLTEVPCGGMEEADGRIIWHVRDATLHGTKCVLIRASDTDVLVLAISHFFTLQELGLHELWMLCGQSKNRRFIPVHAIATAMGEEKAAALRGFHAFSGCDQVSFFATKGKKSHWRTWQALPQTTEAFKILGEVHDRVPEHVHQLLQDYVARLFASQQELSQMVGPVCLHNVRRTLFDQEHMLHLLPPTEAALRKHELRAAYEAGQIWGRVGSSFDSNVPSPEKWGWKKTDEGSWTPDWTDLPWIWEACRELDAKCGCKTQCDSMKCLCRRAGFPCFPGCTGCHGKCTNKE